MIQRPLCSTLFPYTTLFRSVQIPIRVCRFDMPEIGGQDPEPRAGVNTIALSVEHRADRERVAQPVQCWSVSRPRLQPDRKSTRLNSSHVEISYAVFCLKKKK